MAGLTTCTQCMRTVEVIDCKVVAHRALVDGERVMCKMSGKHQRMLKTNHMANGKSVPHVLKQPGYIAKVGVKS